MSWTWKSPKAPNLRNKEGKQDKNKREKTANQDKELGTQPTLEEVLKKEGTSGKSSTAKGQSHPMKGGATKHASK
jgi:hypothetical protein